MKYSVIITAGGSGERMHSDLPKQFHTLQQYRFDMEEKKIEVVKKPILLWTIEQFLYLRERVEIFLVLPKKWIPLWQKFYVENNLEIPHTIVEGGLSRFHSVRNALQKIDDGGVVAVHDGVRPFVSSDFLERMLSEEVSGEYAGVIPCLNAFDSVREVIEKEGSIISSRYVARERLRLVQTPQVFNSTLFKEAYRHPYSSDFTDDASVVEAAGYKVRLVEGERLNIKITNENDKKAAQQILNGLGFGTTK